MASVELVPTPFRFPYWKAYVSRNISSSFLAVKNGNLNLLGSWFICAWFLPVKSETNWTGTFPFATTGRWKPTVTLPLFIGSFAIILPLSSLICFAFSELKFKTIPSLPKNPAVWNIPCELACCSANTLNASSGSVPLKNASASAYGVISLLIELTIWSKSKSGWFICGGMIPSSAAFSSPG